MGLKWKVSQGKVSESEMAVLELINLPGSWRNPGKSALHNSPEKLPPAA